MWRKRWFDYVREVRKKQSKKLKKNLSHKEAMSIASQNWPTVKLKQQKKIARQKKKQSDPKCEAKKADDSDR